MRLINLCIALLLSGSVYGQYGTLSGVYPASNSVTTGAVSLDWAIGSLVPTSLSAFPVRLVSFEGKRNQSGGADLLWKTAEEFSNQGFEVQKSVDGQTYLEIGWLDGKNGDTAQDYNYTDAALTETSYYRLKQVDFSGDFTLSRVVVVVPERESIERVVAYPIPTDNGYVSLTLPDKTNAFTLTNMRGVTLQKTMQPGKKAGLYLPAAGLYLLQVQTKTESKTVKLLRK